MPSRAPCALRLAGGERCLGPLADQAAFVLCEGCVEVEHEGVGIDPKLGHDEWDTLRSGSPRFIRVLR